MKHMCMRSEDSVGKMDSCLFCRSRNEIVEAVSWGENRLLVPVPALNRSVGYLEGFSLEVSRVWGLLFKRPSSSPDHLFGGGGGCESPLCSQTVKLYRSGLYFC